MAREKPSGTLDRKSAAGCGPGVTFHLGGRPAMLEILAFIQALDESIRTLLDAVIVVLTVRRALRAARSRRPEDFPPE